MMLRSVVLLFLVTACAIPDAAPADQSPAPRSHDPTNGYVEMNLDGMIFIYYDHEPNLVGSSAPGEPGYQSYVDLAGGLKPGERKRIRASGPHYLKDVDGTYVLYVFAQAPGGHAEQGTRVVTTSQTDYECYEKELGYRGSGKRLMTLGEIERIAECVKKLSSEAPPQQQVEW